jgi:uncharacterized membrane protein YoaK (UPF0700 family)
VRPSPRPRDPARRRRSLLLLWLTVVTGMVDAVSILGLGRVFVANMTGNVVFAAFALVGAPGFALRGSLLALLGFVAGAATVGRLLIDRVDERRMLRDVLVLEVGLVSAALVVVSLGRATAGVASEVTTVVLAAAMGMQNAVARRLAVPDLTTTVLTMAVTGLGADRFGADVDRAARRLGSVAAMFIGALVGALLISRAGTDAALALAAVMLLAATIAASRPPPVAGR